MKRMPYVNSSRVHNQSILTDRNNREIVNEIDNLVNKVNVNPHYQSSDVVAQINAPSRQPISAFFDNIEDDPEEDQSSDSSEGMEADDCDNGGTSSEDSET